MAWYLADMVILAMLCTAYFKPAQCMSGFYYRIEIFRLYNVFRFTDVSQLDVL